MCPKNLIFKFVIIVKNWPKLSTLSKCWSGHVYLMSSSKVLCQWVSDVMTRLSIELFWTVKNEMLKERNCTKQTLVLHGASQDPRRVRRPKTGLTIHSQSQSGRRDRLSKNYTFLFVSKEQMLMSASEIWANFQLWWARSSQPSLSRSVVVSQLVGAAHGKPPRKRKTPYCNLQGYNLIRQPIKFWFRCWLQFSESVHCTVYVPGMYQVCTRYVPVYVPPPMLHRLCTTSYVVHIMYHVSTVELYGRSEADSFLVGIERERTRILVDQWTAVYVTPARAPRLKCLDLIQSSLFPEGSRERENQHALNTTLLLLSSSPAVVFGLLSDSAL